MTTDVEKELETAVGQAVSDMALPRAGLRAIPSSKTLTVAEQWTRLKTIERDLRERIRQERITILADHESRFTQLHNEHARRVSETVAKLDRDHLEARTRLIEETQQKLRDHDLLSQQL